MIEFVTLFLGLVAGPQVVEVAVAETAAAVEIRLEGRAIGRLEGPPWALEVDLGRELAPRRLEAVAYDAEGAEVGRVEQWLNRPRQAAEAGVVVERGEGGGAIARLTWESTRGRRPLRVTATFDGQPLVVADPERIVLPEHDPRRFHLFEALLEFGGGLVARAEAGIGGAAVDAVGSGLTGVPVVARRKKTPGARELERWLASSAGEVSVAAVERGSARVTVVRCDGVDAAVESLPGRDLDPSNPNMILTTQPGTVGGVGDVAPGATSTAAERERELIGLGADTAVSVLLPRARSARGREVGLELFPVSPEMSRDQGGLFRALTQAVILPGLAEEQRIADAVATSVLGAAEGSHRRAVVLVVAERTDDASLHRADSVRRFARALGVPLFVWRVGAGAVPGWPEATEIDDFRALRRAARELERELDRQLIVWLHGEHDPADLTLAEGAGVGWLADL